MAIVIVTLLSIVVLILVIREFFSGLARFQHLEKRVTDLEQANRQRLPYKSFEEILNGMAALDVLERETEFKTNVIQNAKAHFSKAMAAGTNREK